MIDKKLLTWGAGLALVLGAAACDNSDLTGLNRNPNSPEDVPAPTLFTTAVREAVTRWHGNLYDLRGASLVVQHLAEVQYPDEDRYARLGAADLRSVFDSSYVHELEDLQKVVQKGTAASDASIYGPALVMRTWGFSYLTDSWGDIPYLEALRGDSAGGSISPKYDAQKDIYADFFTVLAKASTDMAAAHGAGIGSADPIYGGDVAKWQRLSNSLRARLALRVVNVDPATADRELRAALAAPGGLLQSNADNAVLDWPGDGVYNNPWSDNFKTRDDHRMSRTLMNVMVPNGDPRAAVYAQPTQADPTKYTGMPNALTPDSAGTWFNISSRPGAAFYPGATAYGTFGGSGQGFPSFLMTYAEVQFIKAEAAARGLGGLGAGQAAGFYADGIRASMAQWGVSATATAAFLAQPAVVYKGGVEGQKQIAIQRWVALYTDGGQAWAEWRRTCQPSTVRPGPNATQANVPRRFLYSPTEVSVNGESLQAAIARQGADVFATRVYWDTKPEAAPTYDASAQCGRRL